MNDKIETAVESLPNIRWDLYHATYPKQCEKASDRLNRAFRRIAKKHLKSAGVLDRRDCANAINEEMQDIMWQDSYCKLGAADTEPRCQLAYLLEQLFGRDLDL